MNKSLQQHLEKLTVILQQIGEPIEGNFYCNINATNVVANPNKIRNLLAAVAGKQKICEIGVNAGHSLLFMLDLNPQSEYVLFDIGIHKYLEPCVNYLKNEFSSTSIQMYIGDSKLTVPAYAEHHKGEFDFCHIDGGHLPPEFTSDYIYCMQLLKKGGILLFDDYDYLDIKAFVDSKIQSGEVVRVVQEPFVQIPQHIVLMKV